MQNLQLWTFRLDTLATFDPVALANTTLTEFEAKFINLFTGSVAAAPHDYDDVQLASDIMAVGLGYGLITSIALVWTVCLLIDETTF